MPSDVSSVKRILSSKYTAIAILLIISIGVYLNTLPNEFVYDDETQVLKNQWIRDVRHIPEILLSGVPAFVGEVISNYYRPLMHIIYMIDYHIFGLRPWGFHLTNIILNAGISVLVFIIISTLINQSQSLNPKSKIQNPESQISNLKSQILSPAFITAILFAAHPIHTEAVAWIAGVPELLFSLFYLLSFYLYTKTDRIQDKRFILSLLFFFFATLCKEPALTLPILLFIYDYSLKRNSVHSSRFTVHGNIKRYLPYLIISGIYFILRIYALRGFAPIPKKHAHLSSYEYFINIFPLFTQYLEKLLLPINMNVFYVFHPISSLFEWKGIITFILTLAFIFLVYFFRRHKVVFLSLFWIVIPLLPVFYIPALGENTFAERYLYLPSIGFVVLVALAIERISQLKALRQTANYVIISILVILIGLYSAGTIKRNYIWRNSYSLWTDTVQKSPDGFIPHTHMGIAYYKKGEINKALKHSQIAIKLMPDSPEPHSNLGNVYSTLGKFDEAIKEYMTAIKLSPDFPEAHYNLALTYSKQERFDEAMKEYMTAIKLSPDFPEPHYTLALTYSKQERFDEAIKEYMIAIKLKPNYPETHSDLGNVYSMLGKFDEAIKEYMIAIKFKPDYPEAHYNLALTYSKQGKFDEAIKEYMIAIRLKPDYPEAHSDLGNAYYRQDRFDEAIKEYMIALRLKPDYANAHYNLGYVYSAVGRFDEAIKEYLAILRLNPEDVEAHYSLGLVYLKKGLKLKAKEEFKTALKLRPDFTPAKKALKSINGER